jgi:transposase
VWIEEVTVFCGIDAHKRFHVAALVDSTGVQQGVLWFANSPEGTSKLRAFLAGHHAQDAPIGIEGSGHFARAMSAELQALGHRVLDVPPWRTRRDRRTRGPGKTDAADALTIAQVVRSDGHRLGAALEPELVRTIRLLELSRRQAVRDRTQLIQRLRSVWLQIDPRAEDAVVACHRKKVLARLRVLDLGPSRAERTAARLIHQMAEDIERLNRRIDEIEREIAELLEIHGNPVADLHGAGVTIASALIAQAGDVRRFRGPAAFARYSGTAPIPCGSGQTSGHHRLYRGGNRQLNAALYRIAMVQARDDPTGRAFMARKQAEGKTKREARRALQRHLANVVYRRLLAWSESALGPAMS